MLVRKKEKKYLYNNNFARLLREMNLYKRVLYLMKKENNNYKQVAELVFSKDTYDSQLSSIFVWSNTKEGHSYWKNVSDKIYMKLKQRKDHEERRRNVGSIGGKIA